MAPPAGASGCPNGAEPRSTSFRVRSVRFAIGTATAAALFATASVGLSDLGFDGPAVVAGEYWRLATSHLTHLDFRHAVTNAVGAGVVAAILLAFHRLATVFGCTAVIAAVISAASLLFFGESRHAGFSGILYGLAAMAVIRLSPRSPWLAATVAIVLIAGIVTALADWGRPWTADIAVHTHLCGIAAGVAIGLWLRPESVGPHDHDGRRQSP